jgi:hypothetical protein
MRAHLEMVALRQRNAPSLILAPSRRGIRTYVLLATALSVGAGCATGMPANDGAGGGAGGGVGGGVG